MDRVERLRSEDDVGRMRRKAGVEPMRNKGERVRRKSGVGRMPGQGVVERV